MSLPRLVDVDPVQRHGYASKLKHDTKTVIEIVRFFASLSDAEACKQNMGREFEYLPTEKRRVRTRSPNHTKSVSFISGIGYRL